MSKCPESVQLGCYTYKIKFISQDGLKEKMESKSDATYFGALLNDYQLIFINEDAMKQMQRLSLLHELTHAIVMQNNLIRVASDDGTNDEETVDKIAQCYYEIMKRNPQVLKWLTED